MTGATGYPAYRGYRCVIPGCGRRVSYKRLMCDDDWRTVPVELRTALRDAFRDAVARRPGARERFHELREQCHQAALDAAGVAPQTGDGTADTEPPAVRPPSRPADPIGAAGSSPQPTTPPRTWGGRRVGVDGEVLEGPRDSTGASTQGEPVASHPAPGPSAPTTPPTQTPAAPDPSAGSASPTAGEEGAPGGRPAAPSEPPQRRATGHG